MTQTETIRTLYMQLGSIRAVARELNLAPSTVHYHLSKTRSLIDPPDEAPSEIKPRTKIDIKHEGDRATIVGKGIINLDDLIAAADLDDSWLCTKHTLNSWQALGKDNATVQLHQVKAYLERAPSFFVQGLDPMPTYKRKPATLAPVNKTALIIPDSQHGFRRVENVASPGGYDWQPMHDRAACDVVLQAAELLQPQEIILLGDMLDLGPWSTRWTSDPSMRFTTNATLRELYAAFLRPLRALCPEARIIYLEGNHEKRIQDAIIGKLDEAHGLRTADTLDGNEVLTVQNLLALHTLDIEYLAPYGAAYWLFDDIRIQHGAKARPGGQTANAYLNGATSSRIFGHMHRFEMAQRKIQTPDGTKIITAATPGCLCRTDGAVPHSGGDYLDWQQGFGIVYQDAETKQTSTHLIPITNGTAVIYGHTIKGDGTAEHAQKLTGLPF